MEAETILNKTQHIAISQNMVCKILRIGKIKARSLLGNQIAKIPTDNNQYGYNLADVLKLTGKNL